jgi:hypothetical protein
MGPTAFNIPRRAAEVKVEEMVFPHFEEAMVQDEHTCLPAGREDTKNSEGPRGKIVLIGMEEEK